MDKKEWLILAEKVIKRTRSYRDNRERGIPDSENFQVYYILTKGETPQDAVAYAVYEDKVIFIRSLDDNGKAFEGYEISFWFGADLFEWLEEGYQLVEMSLESHSCVWQELESCRDDYESQAGIQLYLDYCRYNDITQDLLATKTDYDGMDIMTFYDEQDVKVTKEILQNRQSKEN